MTPCLDPPWYALTATEPRGPAPLEVTIVLRHEGLTGWSWLQDGEAVAEGGDRHVFTFSAPGLHTISLRPVPDTSYQEVINVFVLAPLPPEASASFTLDQTTGIAPMVVTATLTQKNLMTWRWTVNGAIHLPVDGETHRFELVAPGAYTIGLRTMPVLDVPTQFVGVLPGTVLPPTPEPARPWCLNTFESIPEEWAETISAKGWRRVRVEGTDYDRVLTQCVEHDLKPLWILDRYQHLTFPGHHSAEIGNECNNGIGRWPRLTPVEYAAWVREALPVLNAKGCEVYVGSINNFSKEAMDWLRAVLALLTPAERAAVRLSAHRYLDPDQRVDKPKQGFSSLAAEERYWLATVQDRPWAVTEAGIVDATYRDWSSWKYFGKLRTRLAVDGHAAQAARLFRLGAEFYCVYQMQDATGTAFDDRCGIKTVDGRWKATADLPLKG